MIVSETPTPKKPKVAPKIVAQVKTENNIISMGPLPQSGTTGVGGLKSINPIATVRIPKRVVIASFSY